MGFRSLSARYLAQELAQKGLYRGKGGFPQIRGTILGVPIIRTSILGSILGSLLLGNYHMKVS